MTGTSRLVALVIGFAVACGGEAIASQQRPYGVNDAQAEQLLNRIGEKTARFENTLDGAFAHSAIDARQGKDAVRRAVNQFKQAADRLRARVNARRSTALDAEEVLRRGGDIDGFMQRYQLDAQAEQAWLSLRGDLDRLARGYDLAWNWSRPGYPADYSGEDFHYRLTGTYQLQADAGDDPRRVAELAARAVPSDRRQRTYQSLLERLQSPELMAIERRQNRVTVASTRARRVIVDADGRDHVERWSGERTMTTRATLDGERLTVVTGGHRSSDYTVTFDPIENGRSLGVTRTIDDENLPHAVTARSVYRRVSNDARWSLDPGDPRDPDHTGFPVGEFVVPDGTHFVALLDKPLSTTSAREGDVYTMTARSPSQYDGAVIQGVVSSVNGSGRLTGRAGMSLSLQSIRLPGGGFYPFDGVIEDVRTPDGEAVRVDREGMVETDDGLTQKTVERSAIGAGLGAVIGAVAGGGKGAAIGAVIGAGGGAGTVIVEGRDRLDLRRGTEVTITSGVPGTPHTLPGVQR